MEARVREAAQRRKEPCVLDLTPSNVRDYEQGRLSLLHRDVEGILERHQAEYFVSRLECARIRSGFEMREELINYKKALYLLYQVSRLPGWCSGRWAHSGEGGNAS
ncbi:hypothetical protein GUITHDRAFT_161971 [Guillardia theta CCMP2712]|uniref:Uncharacterized protein n=1 Tax=Guillardia theta (strain CCMP2712) TaxID=905079 RepID=L1JNY3_GUITC|nr:hypothetical protein GUITHDRAFT_161971 [Guillardia theta CCMP2712]EKX49900.1 hypothetical protein GUITHDRAFT_161971 [Guillardia theta CCMP2712]|eukprot:XP_005836880.1 hypothetical protein GUITHDRAFT_161971 [Guillardia theta CCMP2712]